MPKVPESIKHVAQPYYQRGQELLTINPLITYFCKLYVIQSAIATNLHQTDNEVAQFVGTELDAVEALKLQLTTPSKEKEEKEEAGETTTEEENRQIINNIDHKGFEYIRDFATSILDSAYTDILAQKSSRSRTVPKLLAAATFLTLALGVFRPEDEPETVKQAARERVKFAKWHAARIARAERNGEDPNAYVPPEVEALHRAEEQAAAAERAIDAAEQQQEVDSDYTSADKIDSEKDEVGKQKQEEDDDEREARELLARMRAEMETEAGGRTDGAEDDEELELPSASSHDPASLDKDNDNDGGFTLPSAASHNPALNDNELGLPAAASHNPETTADISHPSVLSHNSAFVLPSARPAEPVFKPATPSQPTYSPPTAAAAAAAVRSVSNVNPNSVSSSSTTHHLSHTKAEIATILSNSEIFTKSQKHAKFAISALNYEDVATAIRELNQALELLNQVKQD